MRLAPALRDIIKNAQVVSSVRGAKAGTERQTFHKVSAAVSLGGDQYPVIVTIREDANGKFHYDLSMDNTASSGATDRVTEARSGQPDDNGAGAEVLQGGNPANPTVERRSSTSALEGDPDRDLEFSPAGIKSPAGWGEVEADPPITDDAIRAITWEMNAELARTGLAGKINVRVTRDLIGKSGRQIQGMFGFSAATGRPGIQVRAGAPAGERGVMRHEIIHALPSEALRNKPFGLFTGAEWRELARAARAEPEIVASVMERYPEASREMQTEEMVAELYRLWAAQRDTYGGVKRTLAKIEAFLQAMANLLRGKGFVSAARTMEQIAGGRIGGRGPQGPGGRRRQARGAEMREQLNAWSQQVFDTLTGKIAPETTLTLGPVPEIMRVMGGRGNSLVMAASKLQKIRKDHPEVTPQALAKLPSMLADPVFVLDNTNDSRSGDRLFVTDMVLGDDTPSHN